MFSISVTKHRDEKQLVNFEYETLLYGKVVSRENRAFWLVLSRSGFRHTHHFHGNGHNLWMFCFQKPANSKQAWPDRVPYNKLLTNQTSSSRTGDYWPSVVFCTAATSGQYSPVRPSRSVSKRLVNSLCFTIIVSTARLREARFLTNQPWVFS